MERADALKMWKGIFGDKEWATDCFGTWMYREDYGDTKTKRTNRPGGTGKAYSYGWEIDHIRPRADFPKGENPDLMNNFEPMHWGNNRAKGDQYPNFEINMAKYQIVRCEICAKFGLKGYGITNSDGVRIDWKGVTQRYYKNN